MGKVIAKGDIVVYESTVYPGVTEEECLPVVERVSGLKFNEDFFAGYSPERINPGDKLHTVEKIKKVTPGSTPRNSRHRGRSVQLCTCKRHAQSPVDKGCGSFKIIETRSATSILPL